MAVSIRIAVALLAFLPLNALAAEPGGIPDSVHWNIRYRHEQVRDNAFLRRAEADTLRLRLGWAPVLSHGFDALIEGEGVAELSTRFNSGANGNTAYPAVTDARSAQINQAWLGWTNARAGLRIGRQRLQIDDQRFIGASAWRQNEQTFDAVWGNAKLGAKTTLEGGWLGRVHRVAGENALDPLARARELDGRALRVLHDAHLGKITAYSYWIEDRDAPGASSQTWGARWQGEHKFGGSTLGWLVESARQHGYAKARVGGADYVHVMPSLAIGNTTWRIGQERLGRGKGRSFQTPLATLHGFNGWADKFNVTPAEGLVDTYAGVQKKFNWGTRKGQLEVVFHDFRAEHGPAYGQEWNASVALSIRPGLKALVKIADYKHINFSRDAQKLWFQLEWQR